MSKDNPKATDDYFAAGEIAQNPLFGWVPALAIMVFVPVLLVPILTRCGTERTETVVVYAAQDQVYSEPIFQRFTKETGIKVRAVYDSEAVKTVGLANRLMAEKSRPQCDVFWGNEELRTRQLAGENVFRETNGWTAFGYRTRRIVVNTNLVALADAPRTLRELTNVLWRGKVALAYPLFGTTATHLLALRQHWGAANWLVWCKEFQRNKPFLVDGNSVVVNLVGRGEAAVGVTDSDDIAAGQRNRLPVAALPLSHETLLIPNTVAIIRGGPNPSQAEKLFNYLQQPAVIQQLVIRNALEGVSVAEMKGPVLRPQWNALLGEMEIATSELKEVFLR